MSRINGVNGGPLYNVSFKLTSFFSHYSHRKQFILGLCFCQSAPPHDVVDNGQILAEVYSIQIQVLIQLSLVLPDYQLQSYILPYFQV